MRPKYPLESYQKIRIRKDDTPEEIKEKLRTRRAKLKKRGRRSEVAELDFVLLTIQKLEEGFSELEKKLEDDELFSIPP